jgi:chemotaxis protein MotB
MTAKSQPIIVIKKKVGHGGSHGGAWKVAYADFVTAMMSLFIVLWLMGSSEKVKIAVAGYFNDPKGTANLLGTMMTGNGVAVTTETNDNLRKLKEKLEAEIKAKKELEKLSKQIEITITPEGLRIELIEGMDGTFYQSGSPRLSANGQELLSLLAGELKTLPNSLLIEGHTDATQYSTDADYSNWELSADRANSARRLLQQGGVRADQVTQVRGYADQFLRVKDNPYDPSNRRISILVKNGNDGTSAPAIHNARVVDGAPSAATPKAAEGAAKPPVSASPPAQTSKPAAGVPASAQSPAGAPQARTGLMGKLEGMFSRGKK